MYDIITFGSASRDITVKPKNLTGLKYSKNTSTQEQVCFPLGSKIDVDRIEFTTGGGGTNTAATFALQGFKTAFCGMIGQDSAAEEIVQELKKLKIHSSFVFTTNKKSTNHSVIISGDRQDRTILVYRGASELLEKKDIPWSKLKTAWIYIAPLSGLLCQTFEDIVNFAHQHHIRVAANPGMSQLSLHNFSALAKKIDILILNQEEASFLTKIPLEHEKEIFKNIDDMCPGVAVMTKGAEGVVVSDGKHLYSAKPDPERNVVDTTGAGDSFAAGFLSDFIRHDGDIEKAIQLGMANSTACLSQIGAKHGLLKKNQEFKRVDVSKQQII